LEAPQTVNQATIDPSISWEQNGTLAKAAQDATLFSLYLAMQQSALVSNVVYTDLTKDEENAKLTIDVPSFYRQPALAAAAPDWKIISRVNTLYNSGHASDAALFQHMHPSPLSQINDKSKLNDDVINNCSLSTQKRLKARYADQLPEDPTLLDDLIPLAQQTFVA
jgi:hypothetical protein